MDRCKWKRSLAQILQSSPSTLVKMLREDGLLHKWEGHVCPRCCRGTLGGLQQLGGLLKHRCSAKKCHTYINPHHAHPIFVDHWGSSSTPLATQACLLMLLLNRVSHPTIHRLLHVNHKSIEDMEKRLGQLRERWVRNKEKDIKFGQGGKWQDVEADEATFDKKVVNGQLHWEQWCGIVQRGKPQTLSSIAWSQSSPNFALQAPVLFEKLNGNHWLWNGFNTVTLFSTPTRQKVMPSKSRVSSMTGSSTKRSGWSQWRMEMAHSKVCGVAQACPPRQQEGNHSQKGHPDHWQMLAFPQRPVEHQPELQSWQQSSAHPVRSAQYEYWHRGHDLWLATGSLVQWFLLKA